jgi:formylglycine-generating enzyme required for sulfatase activity
VGEGGARERWSNLSVGEHQGARAFEQRRARPPGNHPVGRYAPGASPFGVLDAAGNVFQWTSTRLSSELRVLKGCAWDDDAGLCRPAASHARPETSRHILIGFRCAGPANAP